MDAGFKDVGAGYRGVAVVRGDSGITAHPGQYLCWQVQGGSREGEAKLGILGEVSITHPRLALHYLGSKILRYFMFYVVFNSFMYVYWTILLDLSKLLELNLCIQSEN